MADVLRVTTPLVNKSQVVDSTKNVLNIPQFNLQDISKVAQTNPQAELLMQNNVLTGEEKTSELLMELLKDPAVTVSFLKNIALLQEVIHLLPANNETLTGEIQQMFDLLFLQPDDLSGEMFLQEEASTKFKGEFFNILRGLLEQNPESKQVRQAVAELLKALNSYTTRQDVLDAVANGLEFLSRELAPSKALSQQLEALVREFRAPDAGERFEALKDDVISIFPKIQDSILFSPKMAKVISMTFYNLSRFGTGNEQLTEAVERLARFLPTEELREEFLTHLTRFLATEHKGENPRESKVFSLLTSIINRQAGSEEVMEHRSDQVNKIIQSLLSSPCNFTPLLHFVLPMQYQNIQSFMEFWINPSGEEDEPARAVSGGDNIHMLMVFDIGSLGRFEMELFVRGRVIDFSLFCPGAYAQAFSQEKNNLARCLQSLNYQFGDIRIDELERPRSLMEVFRSLPGKRTGINVKV